MDLSITPPGSDDDPCGKWGCGDHGSCVNNACVCADHWSGAHCQNPPPSTFQPQPSGVDFQVQHPGADFACGNWDTYGSIVKGQSGLANSCNCGFLYPMTGTRCEIECATDEQCGTGTCDTSVGRCVCNEEWSGRQCRIPSHDFKCKSDGDCGWTPDDVKGTCDVDTGMCDCNDSYEGTRCQIHMVLEGDPCSSSSDCTGYKDVCVSGNCRATGMACTSSHDCTQICTNGSCTLAYEPPVPTDQTIESIVNDIVKALVTSDGVAMVAANIGAVKGAEAMGSVLSNLVEKGATSALRSMITDLLEEQAAAGLAGLGEGMLAKIVGEQVIQQAGQLALNEGIQLVAKEAVSKILAPFGAILPLFGVLQIVGMVLDLGDAAGMNEILTQNYVTLFGRKMLEAVNSSDVMIRNNMQFPQEYLPENTVAYQSMFKTKEAKTKMTQYVTEYLDALVVNSNGQPIVKTWTPEKEQQEEKEHSQHPFLWEISEGEQQTFSILKKYWWLILLGVLVVLTVIGLLIGFGVKGKTRTGGNTSPA